MTPARRRATAAAAPAAPTPRPLPIDSSLFFKLVRVVNLTARPFVETVSRAHELSLNEWRTMVVLASHPGVAASDVADLTGLDKMSVSRAIAGLERRGRIRRRTDPADARRMQLALSAEGRALFERIGAQASAREAELFGSVPAAELARLAAVIDRLIEGLQGSATGAAGPAPADPAAAAAPASEAEQARPHRARAARRRA